MLYLMMSSVSNIAHAAPYQTSQGIVIAHLTGSAPDGHSLTTRDFIFIPCMLVNGHLTAYDGHGMSTCVPSWNSHIVLSLDQTTVLL
ncbi:hypothetical protein HD806DRAFT_485946 [Xylariaceae sp. AK1471]|nr:hypothetical protein HD806DRAFT_485946 [Xylariaceae sp. AK1471]